MKLELLAIYAKNNPADPKQACMLVEMRGQSGEVYHFQGSVEGDQRVEDMLTFLSDEIRATRRRKARSTYKVKSLMPKTWGKSKCKAKVEPDGGVTVRQVLSAPILSREAYKLPKKPAKRRGKR
uniref:Uncharacterized protein n=1 Tax=viral metagenome TaxID=1070528 RepID=A0A6M3L8G9_9ZZZZ